MSAPGGYPPPGQGDGYGAPPPQESNTPMILGIIGIVGWFFCGGILGIILGLIGQNKARELGQSETLPKVAWIGGVIALGLTIIWVIIVAASGMAGAA